MSKLITNTIRHTGGSADNITLDNSQNVTVEGNITTSGIFNLGGTTNSSNGVGVVRTKHHTTSNNPVNMIGCVSGSGYNNVQIGGNDTSFAGTAATAVRFYTAGNATTANGTYRGQWDGSGNLTIADGDLGFAAGHGIDFSAQTPTSASGASTTNEVLDHYEEGTWTPALAFGGNTTGITYETSGDVATGGHYTKIGRLVTICAKIALTSKGSATGASRITGLPFTPDNNDSGRHAGAVGSYNNMALDGPLIYWSERNADNILIRQVTTNWDGRVNCTHSCFTDTSFLSFSMTYMVP